MIELRLFGVPVRVELWFFLTAALIGPRDLPGLLLWLPVVLFGVLAHELGHAAAVRRAGFAPAIVLHGFGGSTGWHGAAPLTPARRIVISAAGPAVGLAVGGAAAVVAILLPPGQPMIDRLLEFVIWVNLGWGLLNLLPVLPLDGGVIATAIAERLWRDRGVRFARVASLVTSVALGLWALTAGWLWSAMVAGVLALSNLQAVRASRLANRPADADPSCGPGGL